MSSSALDFRLCRFSGIKIPCFAEALRCMTCGSRSRIAYNDDCMTCFTCELRCPSGAIFVHPFKERFARTLDQVDVVKS